MCDNGSLSDAAINSIFEENLNLGYGPLTDDCGTVWNKIGVHTFFSEFNAGFEFGAVGDGVTDDTDALQACIDAAILTHRNVYIPAGVYKTSVGLNAAPGNNYGLTIRGAGEGALGTTRIVQSVITEDGIVIGTDTTGDADSVVLKDLNVYTARRGVTLNSALGCTVENVKVYNSTYGFYFEGQVESCTIRNAYVFTSTTNGFSLGNNNGTSDGTVQKCVFERILINGTTTGTAFVMGATGGLISVHNTIKSLILESNKRGGVYFNNTYNTELLMYSNEDSLDVNQAYYALEIFHSNIRLVQSSLNNTAGNKYKYLIYNNDATLTIDHISLSSITGSLACIYSLGCLNFRDSNIQIDGGVPNITFDNVASRRQTVIINVMDSANNPIIWAPEIAYFGRELNNDYGVVGNFRSLGSFTVGASEAGIANVTYLHSGIKAWDPPNLAADGDVTSTTVAVSNSVLGDMCIASLSTIGANNMLLTAQISVAGTATVVLMNKTGGAIDIANGSLRVIAIRMS